MTKSDGIGMSRMRDPTLDPAFGLLHFKVARLDSHMIAAEPTPEPPDIVSIQSPIGGKNPVTKEGDSMGDRHDKAFARVQSQPQPFAKLGNGLTNFMEVFLGMTEN